MVFEKSLKREEYYSAFKLIVPSYGFLLGKFILSSLEVLLVISYQLDVKEIVIGTLSQCVQ